MGAVRLRCTLDKCGEKGQMFEWREKKRGFLDFE